MAESVDLVVVGAGPVGLSAALAARSLGIETVLLEAEPADRDRPGSRALYVHRETLTRFERMRPGLGARVAEFGITWRGRRTCYAGREVYARAHGPKPAGRLPPYASLRQVDTEAFLLAACREAGADPVWDARVATVESGDDGVAVRAEDGREWRARYVIGADGGRSAVRGALGIAMDGERSGDYRVAVDLAEDAADPPAVRVMHYRYPALDRRNLLIVPFAGGVQVDVQCAGAADADRLADPDAVRAWLPKVLPAGYAERVLWIARYPCLQRIAAGFVDERRRVLLAGEAAHLFVPFGARGMNSGVADAEAAATAVAVALRAANPRRARAAVEDYDHVRRQAAQFNRQCVEGALRHLRAETLRARLGQVAAARLAPLVPRLGAWLETAPYGPRGTVRLHGGLY